MERLEFPTLEGGETRGGRRLARPVSGSEPAVDVSGSSSEAGDEARDIETEMREGLEREN